MKTGCDEILAIEMTDKIRKMNEDAVQMSPKKKNDKKWALDERYNSVADALPQRKKRTGIMGVINNESEQRRSRRGRGWGKLDW